MNKLLTFLAFTSVVTLTACTSVTKEKINPSPITTKSIAKTVLEEPGLKRLVAIARFSDETKRSAGLFTQVDENGNRYGKQASDILSARLASTNKFIMLERTDEALLNGEAPENARKRIGADYILLGSVSEFGRETTSEVGVFSRNKIQKARATVNVRLVNVKTSEIVYSEEASGEAFAEANRVFGVGEAAAYNSALDDKAISAAISKLVANIMNNLLDMPWESYILSESAQGFIIAGGSSQGINKGTTLSVYQPGELVMNPQTGRQIELPGANVAKIKITKTSGKGDNEISFATVTEGNVNAQNLNNYRIREL